MRAWFSSAPFWPFWLTIFLSANSVLDYDKKSQSNLKIIFFLTVNLNFRQSTCVCHRACCLIFWQRKVIALKICLFLFSFVYIFPLLLSKVIMFMSTLLTPLNYSFWDHEDSNEQRRMSTQYPISSNHLLLYFSTKQKLHFESRST